MIEGLLASSVCGLSMREQKAVFSKVDEHGKRLHSMGCYPVFSTNFKEFADVSHEIGAPKIFPSFYSDDDDPGFWISLRRNDGVVSSVIACRLRETYGSIRESLENGSFLLGRNAPYNAKCDVQGQIDLVSGSILLIGGIFVTKDDRDPIKTQILSRLIVCLGFALYKPDWFLSLVRLRQLASAYDYYGFDLAIGKIRIHDERWPYPEQLAILAGNTLQARIDFLNLSEKTDQGVFEKMLAAE